MICLLAIAASALASEARGPLSLDLALDASSVQMERDLPPEDWWAHPTATDLQPVSPQYLYRHRLLMAASSSGPMAPPTFRGAWSRMETHWALINNNQDGLAFSAQEQMTYRNLTLVSAQQAGQILAQDVIAQSEFLSSVATAVRAVVAPSIEVRPAQGKVKFNQEPAFTQQALCAAQIQDVTRDRDEESQAAAQMQRATTPAARSRSGAGRSGGQASAAPPRRNAWNPTVKVGGNSGLTTGGVETSPGVVESTMSFSVGSYVEVRRIGVDALRLSGEVAEYEFTNAELMWGSTWILSARERLVPGWVMTMDLRSGQGDLRPDRFRPGLSWRVPGVEGWFVQPSYTWTFPNENQPQHEHMAAVRLSWLAGWHMPTDPRRWPLGQRPGAGGPSWPEAQGTPINAAELLYEEPADLWADGAASAM